MLSPLSWPGICVFYVPSPPPAVVTLLTANIHFCCGSVAFARCRREEQRRHHGMPKAAVGDTLQRTGAFGTRPLAQRAGTLWAWWARRAFLGSGRCGRARTRQSSSGRFRSTSLCPILPAAAQPCLCLLSPLVGACSMTPAQMRGRPVPPAPEAVSEHALTPQYGITPSA